MFLPKPLTVNQLEMILDFLNLAPVWVQVFWQWTGFQWMWVPGHWVFPSRPLFLRNPCE